MTDRAIPIDPPEANQAELDSFADQFGPGSQGGFDIRYVIAAIRSNLLLIGAIIATSLALALIATLLDTPRYTAVTTIQINDSTSKVIGEGEDDPATTMSSWDVDRFLKTQTDVLKSRGLALRVAQKLRLVGNSEFYAATETPLPKTALPEERARIAAVGLLRANLKVDLPRDSRIVSISWESADPQMSARVANAFASEFIQSNLQRRFDSSAYAREFVSGQMAEAKRNLEMAERDLNDYARQTGLLRLRDAAGSEEGQDSGGSVTTASLLQLNNAANQAKAARILAEAKWRSVSSGPALSSREVLSNPAIINLMAERARTKANLDEDLSRHLEDYPSVREKRAELARLDAEMQSAAASVRNSVRAEYEAALNAERQLQAQVEGLKNETMRDQDKLVRYALLQREADTSRTLYDGLLKRFNELNAAAGISTSNVSIIDAADVPTAPSSPNLLKNLAIALLAGVGLAALTVLLKDQLDDAIRVPEDVETKMRVPLLGVVPKSISHKPDEDLLDPKSPVSEAYNSLRGTLLYSTPKGLPQIMLVTSAQPSEGKTTTSYATAASLARMGRKVLLIDADLRRPTVHRRIGSENNRGLTALLTSDDPAASAILPTSQDNLSALPSGPVPPSPTELLSSARMEAILRELRSSYDVIIIDSPPVLGLADAPMLSAISDGVIFVVEANRSRRGALKTALRRLRAMRPAILGAVLSKFDPTRSGNRYSEYYGYQYYTYDQSRKDQD